jgi:K+-transporting ATPase KdpF subunit
VTASDWVGLILAAIVAAYLVYALVFPAKL